jgi:hypothetical protein
MTASENALAVGKLYSPRRRQWEERADYNFRSGAHELRIFLAGATEAEIHAVSTGPLEFGLLVQQPELFLITRFGATMSFDCSYSWHRVKPSERVPPPAWEETKPELRALCTIILVEATNGIVLALRAVTFSPEFTRSIHRAIALEAALPYNPAAHEARALATLAGLTTDELWRRCTVMCRGGA